MDLKINGVDFNDVDFLDADTYEAVNSAFEYLNQLKGGSLSGEVICNICSEFRKMLDIIGGEGAGDACMPNNSMMTAIVVKRDVLTGFNAAMQEYKAVTDEIAQMDVEMQTWASDVQNRQQRRAAERAEAKAPGTGAKKKYDPNRAKRDG